MPYLVSASQKAEAAEKSKRNGNKEKPQREGMPEQQPFWEAGQRAAPARCRLCCGLPGRGTGAPAGTGAGAAREQRGGAGGCGWHPPERRGPAPPPRQRLRGRAAGTGLCPRADLYLSA